jgi:hypothetical protein
VEDRTLNKIPSDKLLFLDVPPATQTWHPMLDIEQKHKIKFGGIIPKDVDDPFPDGEILDLSDYVIVPRERLQELEDLWQRFHSTIIPGAFEATIKDEEV